MSAAVTMYGTRFCPYCVRARQLLERKGVAFTEIDVGGRAQLLREMVQRSGRHTVPQIWVGATHVGGYEDLARLEMQGGLDKLLEPAC
ncbi:MAG: glutaredoxin 3 [Halioglobus sp.]|nr:glutaredoxin 3 [Halioglobus sp.]